METLIDKLCKITCFDFGKFLIWYNTPDDKQCDFKELKLSKTEDECVDWLTSTEGIDSQICYDKHMKNYKLSLLYNTMMDKAIGGDTNAARWVESFSKSDYFNDSVDEVDDFLSGVDIPALRG